MASQKRKLSKRKPITEHQLFPAVVALWFGALFGLGSLAIRPSLLEALVIKSGIDLVIPAAAPPLGVTARILIALLMSATGGVLGIILARRIARPRPVAHQRKRGPAATTEPVSARTTAQAAPAGEATGARTRRRALAIEPEEAEFHPHEYAPLPGGAPQVLDIAGMDLGNTDTLDEHIPAAGDQAGPAPVEAPFPPLAVPEFAEAEYTPLDLGDFAEPAPLEAEFTEAEAAAAPALAEFAAPQPAAFAAPTPASAPFAAPTNNFAPPAPPIAALNDEPQPAIAAPGLQAFAAPVAAAEPAPAVAELPPLAEADPRRPAELAMDELALRLAQSMQRRRARASNVPAPTSEPLAAAEEPAPEPQPALTVQPFAASTAPFAAPAEPVSPIPVEQALPRFDIPPAAPAPLEPPAAMRPLSFDHLDGHDDDDALDDLLPPRSISMPQPAPPVAEAGAPQADFSAPAPAPVDEGGEAGDAPYASLLDVELGSSAPRSGFVRVEEPEDHAEAIEPVVIFPGRVARGTHVPNAIAPETTPGGNTESPPMGATPLAAPSEAVPFRRFDPPPSPGQSRPVVAAAAEPALDPAETERALRAALANLQRMSGAA